MRIYLGSPDNQLQAEHAAGFPVLLSYGVLGKSKWDWIDRGYQQSFDRILIDSGAYSTLNTNTSIDLGRYVEWASLWRGHADAMAGLDDISGDWRKSMTNYEAYPEGFPTFHDSDPPELLGDLIAMARERGRWIGLGLVPPRDGKERWIRETCDQIPDDLHVHGWALRAYTYIRRLDSTDSTNWWRDAMDLKALPLTRHLTYAECLDIVCKRYARWNRTIKEPKTEGMLFS
jgi:hypothetical protein